MACVGLSFQYGGKSFCVYLTIIKISMLQIKFAKRVLLSQWFLDDFLCETCSKSFFLNFEMVLSLQITKVNSHMK